MVNVIINLLLIAVILTIVIDLTSIIDDAERMLGKWLHIRARIPKPFSCSFCMTHWTGLLYLIISGRWTLLLYTILMGICFMTPVIKDVLLFIRDLLTKVIAIISKPFE